MTTKEHIMIKSLKHLILALFVFLGFSQTPTAAETIIMACDVTTTILQTNEQRHSEKKAIFKGEFVAFSSEAFVRFKGEWNELCAERPNYVSGTREVTYSDKAMRCVRKDYVYLTENGFEEMTNTDVVFDFAFARTEGKAIYFRKNQDGVFKEVAERTWPNCEIQK